MDAERINRLETQIDLGASALLAGAVGYAAYGLLRPMVSEPALIGAAGAAVAAAYLLTSRALGILASNGARFSLPSFEPTEFIDSGPDELLLTDRLADELLLTEADRLCPGELVLTHDDRLAPGELLLTDTDRLSSNILLLTDGDRLQTAAHQPLDLDDILAQLEPDSRVVRLFDPAAMPTPGQLKGRIDDHLHQGAGPPQSDAAQALADALAELRRSLR
jgi:hypothetical protein